MKADIGGIYVILKQEQDSNGVWHNYCYDLSDTPGITDVITDDDNNIISETVLEGECGCGQCRERW